MHIEGTIRVGQKKDLPERWPFRQMPSRWVQWSPVLLAICVMLMVTAAAAQAPAPPAPGFVPMQLVTPSGAAAPPVTVTLADALERALRNDAPTLAAVADAKVAHDDRNVARAGLLPAISYSTQYLGTQGNGITPNGRFVTNDGVHVYRAWAVLHQEISPNTLLATSYHRATASEAIAKAKAEIAQRSLT